MPRYLVAYSDGQTDAAPLLGAFWERLTATADVMATAYPDDAFPKMKERAAEMKYNFPYLYDESQSVALLYGPKVTPHCFLFDAKGVLVYRGRIDDSAKEAEVTKRELTDALDSLVGEKPISTAQTTAFGCGIKWKAAATTPVKKSS